MRPPVGRSQVVYTDPQHPDTPLTVHTYRPRDHGALDPVVLVHHGMARNGDEYRDHWVEVAERYRWLIVAPTFSAQDFPEPENYNNGKVRRPDGTVAPASQWLYAIPQRVLRALQAAGVTQREKAWMFGHSAGGQFVHRLLATQPEAPFERIAVGNPGWYTLPTLDRPFPEGLGGLGLSQLEVQRWLTTPMNVLAGDQDIDTTDPSLPNEPAARAQGSTRYARAHYFVDFAQAQARTWGVVCAWNLITVAGVGHDGQAMGQAVARAWLTRP